MISFVFLLATAIYASPRLTPQPITGILSIVYPGQTDPNARPTAVPAGVLPASTTVITAKSCATFLNTLGGGFNTACGGDLCSSTCFSSVQSILTGTSLTQLIQVCQPTLANAQSMLGNFSRITAKCGPLTPNNVNDIVSQFDSLFGEDQGTTGTTSTPPPANQNTDTGIVSVPAAIYEAPQAHVPHSSGFIAQASMLGLFGIISQIIL